MPADQEQSKRSFNLTRRHLLRGLLATVATGIFANGLRINSTSPLLEGISESAEAAVRASQTPVSPTSVIPGVLNLQYPLGVANTSLPNATDFAYNILRMNENGVDPMVYVQEITRSRSVLGGRNNDAAWCPSVPPTYPPSNPTPATTPTPIYEDAEAELGTILREISTHDHFFGRRNILDGRVPLFHTPTPSQPNKGFANRAYSNNLIFYLYNEPEAFIPFTTPTPGGANTPTPGGDWYMCQWSVPQNQSNGYPKVDRSITATPVATVLQVPAGSTPGALVPTRIRAQRLGAQYLDIRSRLLALNKGHVLLMPSAISADFLQPVCGSSEDYWEAFFDTVLLGTGHISVQELRALHTHYYPSYFPGVNTSYNGTAYGGYDPMKFTASLATKVSEGVNWFKNTYNGGNDLPLNYILSETGPAWEELKAAINDQLPSAFTAGFPDFVLAQSYWNTYLFWLSRRAKSQIGLQNGYGVFSMIHIADSPPHLILAEKIDTSPWQHSTIQSVNRQVLEVTASGTNVTAIDSVSQSVRYITFGCDVGETPPTSCVNYIVTQGMTFNTGWTVPSDSKLTHTYKDEYNANKTKSYYMAPLGATLSVWSKIAADASTNAFGSGFYYHTANGTLTGTAEIVLKPGWNSVYIPFVKTFVGSDTGPLTGNNCGNYFNDPDPAEREYTYTFSWSKMDGTLPESHGKMYTGRSLMPDPRQYQIPPTPVCNPATPTPGPTPVPCTGDGSHGFMPYNNGWVETATIAPILIWVESEDTDEVSIKLTVARSGTGTKGMVIGRPIVLQGIACSWVSTQ
jgi:hypothetical protein